MGRGCLSKKEAVNNISTMNVKKLDDSVNTVNGISALGDIQTSLPPTSHSTPKTLRKQGKNISSSTERSWDSSFSPKSRLSSPDTSDQISFNEVKNKKKFLYS